MPTLGLLIVGLIVAPADANLDCSRWLRRIRLLSLALALAGCSAHLPTKPSELQPGLTPPEKAVRLLEACWDQRNISSYEELFTDDYQFVFAPTDTAGNAFLGRSMSRHDEIEGARHLFVGGGTMPPADSITLVLDHDFIVLPDPRPGKGDTTYHCQIATSVVLLIRTPAATLSVAGRARFFLVRGDSAFVPHELVARGVGSDSTRWYIQRWEDETVTPAPYSAAARGMEQARRW